MKNKKDKIEDIIEGAASIVALIIVSFWAFTFLAWSFKFCIDIWKGLF